MPYIYGIHAVKAALVSQDVNVDKLYITYHRDDARGRELIELAQQANIPIQRVTAVELQQLVPGQKQHQGVAASCQRVPVYDEDTLIQLCQHLPDDALFLILDGVQDPQNLGACLRTANVAAVTAVIAPKNRAATLTATVHKVSCGAATMTPFIQVTNLARSMRFLQEQGIWLYGADANAKTTIWQSDLRRKAGIVMGGEGGGLRQLTRKHCDELMSIPQYGEVPSLNVSVAAAICLYEVRRQQAKELVPKDLDE